VAAPGALLNDTDPNGNTMTATKVTNPPANQGTVNPFGTKRKLHLYACEQLHRDGKVHLSRHRQYGIELRSRDRDHPRYPLKMKRFLSLLLFVVAAVAHPCAAIGVGQIEFGGQRNIIVWDAASKTQHFVRIANFQSESPDIGFLAPTPSIPELVSVDSAAFSLLDGIIPVQLGRQIPLMGSASASTKSESAPEIVQETRVGNYVATTFKAGDASALAKYLDKYGFKVSQIQTQWLDKYVQQGWYITAFQVVLNGGTGKTTTVRMTFKTDQPFNPYYVPADNISGNSAGVALYFVSKAIYEGAFEDKTKWATRRVAKTNIPDADRTQLASYLKIDPSQVGDTLTYDLDFSFPKVGVQSDLFFAQISTQTPGMGMYEVRTRDYVSGRYTHPDSILLPGVCIGIIALMITLFSFRARIARIFVGDS
jgi:hypothetical protein